MAAWRLCGDVTIRQRPRWAGRHQRAQHRAAVAGAGNMADHDGIGCLRHNHRQPGGRAGRAFPRHRARPKIMQSTLQATVIPIHIGGRRPVRKVIHFSAKTVPLETIDECRYVLSAAGDMLDAPEEVHWAVKYKPSSPQCQTGHIQLPKWKPITAHCDSCLGIVK